jgi:hypothetical protein
MNNRIYPKEVYDKCIKDYFILFHYCPDCLTSVSCIKKCDLCGAIPIILSKEELREKKIEKILK